MVQDNQYRLKTIALLLIFIGIGVVAKSFHTQIVRGSYYTERATLSQTQSLEVSPKRGVIYAVDGEETVPLVLNERRWLVFSDPYYIEDIAQVVDALDQSGIGVSDVNVARLESDTRYVKLASSVQDKTKLAIESLGVKGLYFQEQSVRSYPEGDLASHVLGFINTDLSGQYGVEQQYQKELSGVPGRVEAITDAAGIPLAFEQQKVEIQPVDGKDIKLTIDVPLQRAAQDVLRRGVESTSALSGSIIIMDAETGAIQSMANYPDFSPASYSSVADPSDYTNSSITGSIEPGSIVKTLVATAALDEGVITPESTYFDQGSYTLDGATISNALEYGIGTKTVTEILSRSLNTGSTYLLSQLGSGSFNQEGRTKLYDYYTGAFGLGGRTGIDLPNEAAGIVASPDEGFGLNIRYANMTFGQGLTVTPLQMAAAYSAVFNGGSYYQPYVVSKVGDRVTEPVLLRDNIISPEAYNGIREIMKSVGELNYPDLQSPGLEISGKTGTAEIADGQGGYLEDDFTGTFVGYIKSDSRTLVISVRIDRPQVRFAGSQAAAPIWRDMVNESLKLGRVL